MILKYFIPPILQKIGYMGSLFSKMKKWALDVLLPAHLKLIGLGEFGRAETMANESMSDDKVIVENSVPKTHQLLLKMVEKVIANPKQVVRSDKFKERER